MNSIRKTRTADSTTVTASEPALSSPFRSRQRFLRRASLFNHHHMAELSFPTHVLDATSNVIYLS